jgi:hypothetical protein
MLGRAARVVSGPRYMVSMMKKAVSGGLARPIAGYGLVHCVLTRICPNSIRRSPNEADLSVPSLSTVGRVMSVGLRAATVRTAVGHDNELRRCFRVCRCSRVRRLLEHLR